MLVKVIGIRAVSNKYFYNAVVSTRFKDCCPERLVTVFIDSVNTGTVIKQQRRTI